MTCGMFFSKTKLVFKNTILSSRKSLTQVATIFSLFLKTRQYKNRLIVLYELFIFYDIVFLLYLRIHVDRDLYELIDHYLFLFLYLFLRR